MFIVMHILHLQDLLPVLSGFPRALTPHGLENATPRFEDRPSSTALQYSTVAGLRSLDLRNSPISDRF